ncbi:DUF4139 domain-containing protein [Sphingobium phenoxybenzoativorans]|uniref:DUF4139 domain-containing protein n=1 Tax=Sphingobium phenoxybenzoativorans TaxID=1592790 RepID=A0A975Q0R4_9SPHN|nr:DUF4139 domain-containing protein [Sphingobium phenoxybenzoativorans]QUT05019.1 DUF4139 domain-containing protein [Sphingobium phenoxybenzoativorans]
MATARIFVGLALTALAALPVAALAQAGGSAQGDISVTIYNNNLALVQDVRTLPIERGVSRIEFPDVSAQIRPETVSFAADGTAIVEQNFDFDLLSPSKLMEKAVGQVVTIVRTNPATGAETREQAKVLAVNGGTVLQIGSRIEVLRDDGLPVRVIFDKVPPNLRPRPTLSVTVDSDRAGARPASLRYLTPGLGWAADYVALFDSKAGRIDVQGWVTLTNSTGTTYTNAHTLLVAGQVGTSNPGYGGYGRPRAPGPLRRAGTETASRERLGDFYLYPIAARTTIADRQTKQVSFLDVQGVPAKAGYEYRNDWLNSVEEPQSFSSVVKFSTSGNGGLGDALPAGTVRFYMKDASGAPQFIGENSVGHTPMGSELALATGEAFDVKVQPVVEKRERLGDHRWRTTMRYEISNAKPEAVTVDLTQAGLDWIYEDTRIVSESQPSKRRNSDSTVWTVAVPANGRVIVNAVFDTRY